MTTNLELYSQQLDNAYWDFTSFGTVAADAGAAPDGTTSADSIADNGGYAQVGHNVASVALDGTSSYTYSFYFKRTTTGRQPYLQLNDYGGGTKATAQYFNLDTLAGGGSEALAGADIGFSGATVTSVGSGWFRCSVAFPSSSYTAIHAFVGWCDAVGSRSASSGSGLFWGMQCEIGTSAGTYVPTTSAPASASSANAGTLAVTLGGIGCASVATVRAQGAVGATLQSLGITFAGSLPLAGTLAATLGSIAASSAGAERIGAAGAPALGSLTLTSIGILPVGANAAPVLGAVGLTAAAAVSLTGSFAASLGPVSSAGAAATRLTGSLTAALDPVTISASGAASAVVTTAATASLALGSIGITAVGSVPLAGSLSITLGQVLVSGGAAGQGNRGDAAVSLGAVSVASAGSSLLRSSALLTLGPVTSASVAVVPLHAVAALALGLVTLSAVGGEPRVLVDSHVAARTFRAERRVAFR